MLDHIHDPRMLNPGQRIDFRLNLPLILLDVLECFHGVIRLGGVLRNFDLTATPNAERAPNLH